MSLKNLCQDLKDSRMNRNAFGMILKGRLGTFDYKL